MTHATIVVLAVLGVVGQVLVALIVLSCLAAAVGVGGPLHAIRSFVWGYELWAAFLVAAVATGGSLFFSEIAGFVPCELCWYQRICMYPLSLLTLFAAAHRDYRFARYLLPLPIVGAGVSVYHLLIENVAVAPALESMYADVRPVGPAPMITTDSGAVTLSPSQPGASGPAVGGRGVTGNARGSYSGGRAPKPRRSRSDTPSGATGRSG